MEIQSTMTLSKKESIFRHNLDENHEHVKEVFFMITNYYNTKPRRI